MTSSAVSFALSKVNVSSSASFVWYPYTHGAALLQCLLNNDIVLAPVSCITSRSLRSMRGTNILRPTRSPPKHNGPAMFWSFTSFSEGFPLALKGCTSERKRSSKFDVWSRTCTRIFEEGKDRVDSKLWGINQILHERLLSDTLLLESQSVPSHQAISRIQPGWQSSQI